VIPSTPSPFEKLFESAPELMTNVTIVAERAANLLSEENIGKVASILSNVDLATGEAAARVEDLRGLIAEARGTAVAATRAADSADALLKDARGSLARVEKEATGAIGDFRVAVRDTDKLVVAAGPAVEDLRATARNFAKMAAELETLARETRQPVRDFSDQGLYEITAFFSEARALVASLQRVSAALERDPARFLFGDQTRGFEPPR
jgi:phospholipid/cholesterol/gamma-HCH transport system substrate-binding protein